MNDFDTVINNVTLFHKIFDIIRIVDPVKKEVVFMKKNIDIDVLSQLGPKPMDVCYGLWATGEVCANCIAMRALLEQDVFIKFEYVSSMLFMITAYPLDVPYSGYVVEIVKDVTDSELIDDFEGLSASNIRKQIELKNRHVIIDNNTSLYNERYLSEKLPFELVNNNLKGFDSALLMIQIDHFDNVQNAFGHSASASVLKKLAHLILKCIREDYDWAVRTHDDAFLIYLKNIQLSDLKKVCEKIRHHTATAIFEGDHKVIPITVSIGASHISSALIIDYESFVSSTQKNLEHAQAHGRNQYYCKEVTL